jgi:hypothetical protein
MWFTNDAPAPVKTLLSCLLVAAYLFLQAAPASYAAAGCTNPGFNVAQSFSTGTNPSSVAVGDFNGDGRQDLATANYGDDTASLLGDRTNNFILSRTMTLTQKPNSVAAGDFNHDGRMDLAAAVSWSDSGVAILFGDGRP